MRSVIMSSKGPAIATTNALMAQNFTDGFIHEKIIYAKRNGMTNKELEGVMQLEISNVLRQRSGFEFEGVDKTVKNADQSITYFLKFKKIIPQVK
jgi:hypothetical protein